MDTDPVIISTIFRRMANKLQQSYVEKHLMCKRHARPQHSRIRARVSHHPLCIHSRMHAMWAHSSQRFLDRSTRRQSTTADIAYCLYIPAAAPMHTRIPRIQYTRGSYVSFSFHSPVRYIRLSLFDRGGTWLRHTFFIQIMVTFLSNERLSLFVRGGRAAPTYIRSPVLTTRFTALPKKSKF